MEFFFALLIFCISLVAAQNQTRAQLRQRFQPQDFVFDVGRKVKDSIGLGGIIKIVTSEELKSLSGEGVALVLLELEPCSINPPHLHPRATEIDYVLSGERVEFGFVEENGGRILTHIANAGQSSFVPKGIIHYAQNFGCSKAKIHAMFNSDDPGFISVIASTIRFSAEVVESSLSIDQTQFESLKKNLPKAPTNFAKQSECFQRCKIQPKK
jgi:oxalate decarboxylase/phosphoglucose isomerase-like protein (cupin superfamily)